MSNGGERLEIVNVLDLRKSFCYDPRAVLFEVAGCVKLVLIDPPCFHDRGARGDDVDGKDFSAVQVAEVMYFQILGSEPLRGVGGSHCLFVCKGLACITVACRRRRRSRRCEVR